MSENPDVPEPIDPDATAAGTPRRRQGVLLAVIGLGGGLGALARHGVAELWPTPVGGFPWSTLVVNASGCLLIGVLLVLVTEVYPAHPLVRPFLGVGVLGGYTTFSSYAIEALDLLRPGTVGLAFGYLAGTVLAALAAVTLGALVARALTGRATPEPT